MTVKKQGFMGTRRKARECALQMLFAADITRTSPEVLVREYWNELGEPELDEATRDFSARLTIGTLRELAVIDDRIRTRAEHWRIERMAIVDRNVTAEERSVVEAFRNFLWSDDAQKAFVKNHFRSVTNESLNSTNAQFAKIELPFTVEYFGGWGKAYPEIIEKVFRDQVQNK